MSCSAPDWPSSAKQWVREDDVQHSGPDPALEYLFRPRSIAIIGASEDFSKINGRPLKFLLDKEYPGKVFPVNPKHEPGGHHRAVHQRPGPILGAVLAGVGYPWLGGSPRS